MPVTSSPPGFWEIEYNPRWRIPDSQRWFDAWRTRAADARGKLAGMLDIPYGPHSRERLDLFRAPAPRGTLVFIHGGYWRAFDKEAQSWIAEPFVRAGVTVAIPNYPLAPGVRLTDIVDSIARASAHLQSSLLTGDERRRLVVVGHSAGAHLAACLLAAGRDGGRPPDAIVCISGVFDLLPLLHTQMLGDMGWDAGGLQAVSPLFMLPPKQGAVVLAVGSEESEEFHTQSTRLARAWSGRVTTVLRPQGRHHYSILEGLVDPEHELHQAVLEQLPER
jgi:arylformamidase